MADQDVDKTPDATGWSLDPTGGAARTPAPYVPPSIELDPRFRLPPDYFAPPLEANGTSAAAANVFSGLYDAPAPGGGGNPLEAAAGSIDRMLQHPGGSDFGVNAGSKSLQYAPTGGVIPGLIDQVQVTPYIDGVPGLSPPGMPAPWESGH